MDTAILIEKLLEIERAIGREDPATIRIRVIDAQDWVLRVQRERIESLRISSGRTMVLR